MSETVETQLYHLFVASNIPFEFSKKVKKKKVILQQIIELVANSDTTCVKPRNVILKTTKSAAQKNAYQTIIVTQHTLQITCFQSYRENINV